MREIVAREWNRLSLRLLLVVFFLLLNDVAVIFQGRQDVLRYAFGLLKLSKSYQATNVQSNAWCWTMSLTKRADIARYVFPVTKDGGSLTSSCYVL